MCWQVVGVGWRIETLNPLYANLYDGIINRIVHRIGQVWTDTKTAYCYHRRLVKNIVDHKCFILYMYRDTVMIDPMLKVKSAKTTTAATIVVLSGTRPRDTESLPSFHRKATALPNLYGITQRWSNQSGQYFQRAECDNFYGVCHNKELNFVC